MSHARSKESHLVDEERRKQDEYLRQLAEKLLESDDDTEHNLSDPSLQSNVEQKSNALEGVENTDSDQNVTVHTTSSFSEKPSNMKISNDSFGEKEISRKHSRKLKSKPKHEKKETSSDKTSSKIGLENKTKKSEESSCPIDVNNKEEMVVSHKSSNTKKELNISLQKTTSDESFPQKTNIQSRGSFTEDVSETSSSSLSASLIRTTSASYMTKNNKDEAFSIADARKMLDKKKKLFMKDKSAAKKLSFRAFDLPANKMLTEDQIDEVVIQMLDPRQGIPIGKRKSGLLETFDCCFTGEDASLWIKTNFGLDSMDKAVQLGQTLFMNRSIFYSLSKKHISFHDKPDVLYRFVLLDPPSAGYLNNAKTYMEEISEHPTLVSTKIVNRIMKILGRINLTNMAVTNADLQAIRISADFRLFVLKLSRLHKVQISRLVSTEEKTLFFLNIYNVLIAHCYIQFGIPQSSIERKEITSKYYKIEGKKYSLDQLFTILRGLDPDLRMNPSCNPLFHFCLFNGCEASPLIRPYVIEEFQDQLNAAAREYLEKNVRFVVDSDEIWLPKMLKDCGKDFADSEKEILLKIIAKYIPSQANYIKTYIDTIEIKYQENIFGKIQFVDPLYLALKEQSDSNRSSDTLFASVVAARPAAGE